MWSTLAQKAFPHSRWFGRRRCECEWYFCPPKWMLLPSRGAAYLFYYQICFVGWEREVSQLMSQSCMLSTWLRSMSMLCGYKIAAACGTFGYPMKEAWGEKKSPYAPLIDFHLNKLSSLLFEFSNKQPEQQWEYAAKVNGGDMYTA